MGWFTDAKIWVQSVLAHETTAAIGNSIYDTAVYSFEQIGDSKSSSITFLSPIN